MTSVHPEIVIQETPQSATEQKKPETKTFYFQTQSGKVFKIQAESENSAISIYLNANFPQFEMPYNDTFCCMPYFIPGECNGPRCIKNGHYLKIESWDFMPWKKEIYAKFLNGLLRAHPDFFSSGRYEEMYNEDPHITQRDFENSITRPDGTTRYWNPRSYTYFWERANVRLQTRSPPNYPFDYAIRKLAGENYIEYHNSNVCHSVILTNIPLFTPEAWDFLGGSLKPTTERPAAPTPQAAPAPAPAPAPAQEEKRRPTRALRQRRKSGRTYDAICISETG